MYRNDSDIWLIVSCHDHLKQRCYEPQWGQATGSDGLQHDVATVDDEGPWSTQKYKYPYDGNSTGELILKYSSYMYKNSGSKENMRFHFMSDLWNSGSGSGGLWHHELEHTMQLHDSQQSL